MNLEDWKRFCRFSIWLIQKYKSVFSFFFFNFFVCWGGDYSLALCSPPSSYWTHKPPAAHPTPFAILILKQTTHNPKHTTQHKHTTHDTTHNTYGTKHNPKSYLTLVIFSALFMFHGFLLPPLLPFYLRFSERKTSSSVRIYFFTKYLSLENRKRDNLKPIKLNLNPIILSVEQNNDG